MTVAEMDLTEEQRGQLIEVLDRRFRKMSNHALLELERLTRHPVDLATFQAKSNLLTIPQANPSKLEDKNFDHVIDAKFSKPMTRREFLGCLLSGSLGMLAVGTTGYGWWKSNESAQNLSAAIQSTNANLSDLAASLDNLQTNVQGCNEVVSEFLNDYPLTLYSLALLRENIEKTQNLYSQLDQTGMTIAEIIEAIVNVMTLVPHTELYTKPVNSLLDAVKNIPEVIFWVEQALATLDPWFNDNEGINSRLLLPIQIVFDSIDNDLKTRLDVIQSELDGM
jgi:hypothetical protein